MHTFAINIALSIREVVPDAQVFHIESMSTPDRNNLGLGLELAETMAQGISGQVRSKAGHDFWEPRLSIVALRIRSAGENVCVLGEKIQRCFKKNASREKSNKEGNLTFVVPLDVRMGCDYGTHETSLSFIGLPLGFRSRGHFDDGNLYLQSYC